MWWLGHVERKDYADWLKMEFEGTRQRGHLRKTRWDCIKGDMESFGLFRQDAHNRDHWRLKIKGEPVDPGLSGKWALTVRARVCVSN